MIMNHQDAERRLRIFEHGHGTTLVQLASHAALPVVLNPDFVHLLRVNYFLDPPFTLPYAAEAELLLSPLCTEVDQGLYVIDPELRDVLLQLLIEEYGSGRLHDLARLLWEYGQRSTPWLDRPGLAEAQQLTALNFIDPARARDWLARAEVSADAGTAVDERWFVAIRQDLDDRAAALERVEEHAGQATEAVTRPEIAGHVFISYFREDSHHVYQLQRTLQTAGFPVWRDTSDLWPGEDWKAKIRRAITDDALVFIACFSKKSLARGKGHQNEEELILAVEQLRLRPPGDKWLIPVRFDECEIPNLDIGSGRTLRSIQRADMFGDHSDQSAARLIEAIQRILQRPQGPDAAFWDVLDPTDREALRSVASMRTFAAGARIMEEGEPADHVMVILGGQVEIRIEENGSERVVAVRGLGQLVGERDVLKVSLRSVTVVALEMVWALVMQTKDFAAFITARPRVLDIVQNQVNQRHTAGAPRYEHDESGDSPADPVGGTATGGRPDEKDSAGYSRKRPKTLTGENCTVILTDVVDFGARTRNDNDRLLIREALFEMTQKAMQGFPDAQSEDRGDGILTVVPPNASTARVLDQLVKELPAALERHNSTQGEPGRFKLRVAVNVGPVVSHMDGVSGEAIIVAARLVEAPDFKDAVARSTASLGVIASPFVYEAVVRHSSDPREVASYAKVSVEVKETSTTAWIKLFSHGSAMHIEPGTGQSATRKLA
jgi:CRP-like cAMP-binding protein